VRGKLDANDCHAVTTVGGQGDAAVAALGGACHLGLVGSDRYDTSYKVYNEFSWVSWVGVATGESFPDALSGGAFMANLGNPLILVDPASLPYETATVFGSAHAYDGVSDIPVFGGPRRCRTRSSARSSRWCRPGSTTVILRFSTRIPPVYV